MASRIGLASWMLVYSEARIEIKAIRSATVAFVKRAVVAAPFWAGA